MKGDIYQHNCALLQQLHHCLNRSDIQNIYCVSQFGATIGAHVRHALDHYSLFIDCLQCGQTPLKINYDHRPRDLRLETCWATGLDKISEIQQALEALSESDVNQLSQKIWVACSTDICQDPVAAESTLGREYQFLHSHTLHHMALIKALASRQAIDLGERFGVAPSTLKATSHSKRQVA